jgi:hypothetical protein
MTKQFQVGDVVFQGWGEYSSSRPADIDSPFREIEAEAQDDASVWFSWLTKREQAMANFGVTRYRVTAIEDDGSIGSAVSF